MVCSNNPDERKESQFQSKSFTIKNKLGIHVRPATQLVKTASKFDSNICIEKGELQVDAKSIMGVLLLAASQGSSIVIRAEGRDAREALDQLGILIEEGFGEE
ncbi:MAG: HPr family phosphocarrier protein [Pseudomonadota bacterium]